MTMTTMATALAAAETVNFDDMKAGAPPPSWTATQTGSGAAKWSVEKDNSAPSKPNVLKQSGQATFPVCFKNDTNIKDGFVEVKFKPISGKEDQAGGVIWRLQDGNNYYIARANALENNVTIYHTIKAKRKEKKRTSMKVASGAWHRLHVDFRGNHFALDPSGERLFVCALGNNTVEVLDLRKGQRIHSITGLGSPQGIVYVSELNRIFVANDKGGIFKIYDGKLFQSVAEVDFKDDADNVRYDDASKKIYVGFGSGGIAIVNAPDGKQLGSIKLPAHPEAFELEKHGSRIFVNVPNARHVAVIDRDKGEVVTTWKTDLAFGNFPMALDEANHRLFIGCRVPSKLVVLSTDSGNVEIGRAHV